MNNEIEVMLVLAVWLMGSLLLCVVAKVVYMCVVRYRDTVKNKKYQQSCKPYFGTTPKIRPIRRL